MSRGYVFSEDICVKFELLRWDKETLDRLIKRIVEPDLKIGVRDVVNSSIVEITLIGRNYCAFNRIINFVIQEEKKDPRLTLNALFITTKDEYEKAN